MPPFSETITHYLRAGFPALYVQTYEERRAIEAIRKAAKHEKLQRPVHLWSITRGWIMDGGRSEKAQDPMAALNKIEPTSSDPEAGVYVLLDFHPFVGDHLPDVVRRLRDLIPMCKATGRTIVIVSPRYPTVIPIDLEKEITVLEFALPSRDELGGVLDVVVESVGAAKAKVNDRTALLEAARGQTMSEAENTFSLALVQHGALGDEAVTTIQREKANIIKKTGLCEYHEASTTLDDVKGLDELKAWLRKRSKAFSDKARAYPLKFPRGLMLVGQRGCGKSLTAKSVARTWRLPLLRLDFARLFAGIVGATEENVRRVIALAEAIAPCVLWVDEVEKGLSGLKSSGVTDGGVSARAFGTFLTWLNDKTAAVFVIMTSNDIGALPPEFIRKGRVDEIFFVDLPNQFEAAEIFAHHLRMMQRDPKKFDITKLAAMASNFSGAEIEEVINAAMFDAFDADQEVTTTHILKAIESTTPLAVTNEADVTKLREEQRKRKWRVATSAFTPEIKGRRVNV